MGDREYVCHECGKKLIWASKSHKCEVEPPESESDYNRRLRHGFNLMSEEEVIYYQPWEIQAANE